MNFKSIFIGLCSIAILISGGLYFSLDRNQHSSPIPFRMYETEIIPDIFNYNITDISWLNDSTVIFKGFTPPGPQTRNELNSTPDSLFVWRLGEEAQKLELDKRWSGHFCVSKAGLFYRLKPQKDGGSSEFIEYVEGWPENEKYIKRPRKTRNPDEPVSCKSDLYRGCGRICRNSLVDRNWMPLIDNIGFIDYGNKSLSKDSTVPLKVDIDNNSDVVETAPLPLREISHLKWYYIPFNNGYFTWEFTTANVAVQARWKNSNCMPLWWIWTDGRTQRICVPAGPWVGSTSFSPLLRGVFFHSINPKAQGGYMLLDGEVHKVVKGVVVNNHVSSPDGCKIAFIRAEDVHGKSPSLKVMDFCMTELES